MHAHPIHNPIEKIKEELRKVKRFDVSTAILVPWVRNEYENKKKIDYLVEGEEFEKANNYVLECGGKNDEFYFIPYCSIAKGFNLPANFNNFKGMTWYYLSKGCWSWNDAEKFLDKIGKKRTSIIMEDKLSIIRCAANYKIDLMLPHAGLNNYDENPEEFWKEIKKRKNVHFDTSIVSKDTLAKCVKIIKKKARFHFASDYPISKMTIEEEIKKLASVF